MMSLATRILPFILTFALGLFLASFFVSLSVPKVKFERRYSYRNECNYRRMQRENWRREHKRSDFERYENQLVPPPPLVAPLAPVTDFDKGLEIPNYGSGGGRGINRLRH